jgi:TolB-like protein
VEGHFGRIVEFNGDGAMCSFPSTLEAVRAAIAVQLDMQEPPKVPLRIGMHTGDVMLDGHKIYGDSVNIASRMESFAQRGSILVSRRVYDDIKNHQDIQTVSLGTYALKNVSDPAQIFAISNPGIVVPDVSSLQGKGEKAGRKTILVLPFINMSNDPEQEYFSDGLTEELISGLTKLTGIRVVSRTTSMRYKHSNKDIQTINKETGAGYVVEGSVRTHVNNLRITAQFIDAVNDIHIWAENFSGTLNDIFDIQEKVAAKIVGELSMHLTGDEKNTLRKRYTENTEAYRLYLKGRFFWKKRNAASLKSAVEFFHRAIDADAKFALAWAGLADSYNLMGEFSNISRRELYPKAMYAVKKALEIDNGLAEAHISYAISLMLNDWDWVNAEKEFLLGIELGPNYATGHHWYAEYLLFTGRTAEAFSEISLAVDLDPLSQGILKDQGIFYYYNRQYDESISIARKTLELDPGFSPAYRLLSLNYTAIHRFGEAIEENQRWANCINNKPKTDVALAYIYANAGRIEETKKIIMEVESGQLLSGNDYRGMALVYVALGEKDKAFEWLDKSYDMHEESLCSIRIDPKFDMIRDDPRFDELLKKVNLL